MHSQLLKWFVEHAHAAQASRVYFILFKFVLVETQMFLPQNNTDSA